MPNLLITGCSSGIGHATAARLARSGRWTVYATARRIETLDTLAAAGCRTLALHVTDEASMSAAVAARARSSTSPRWAAGSRSPAAAPTTHQVRDRGDE